MTPKERLFSPTPTPTSFSLAHRPGVVSTTLQADQDPNRVRLSLWIATLDRFDLNSATLTTGHRGALIEAVGRITSLLRRMPTGNVLLTGHTDLVGGESANLDLGRRRGTATGVALLQAGIPMGSMSLTSMGEAAPVIPTREAEPRNRRVEIRFQAGAMTDAPLRPDARPEDGGGPARPDLNLPKDFLDPHGPVVPSQPDWAKPVPLTPTPPFAPAPELRTSGHDPSTKAAGAGELFKALLATRQGKVAAQLAKDTAKRGLGALKPGEKAALATFTVAAGAGVTFGLSKDPAAAKLVLDELDNKDIDVKDIPGLGSIPGLKDIPGLKIRLHTAGGVGGGLQIDLTQVFRELK